MKHVSYKIGDMRSHKGTDRYCSKCSSVCLYDSTGKLLSKKNYELRIKRMEADR